MRYRGALVLAALLLPAGGAAQKAVLPNTTPARNPVSTAIKERLEDQTKNFVAGAEYSPPQDTASSPPRK